VVAVVAADPEPAVVAPLAVLTAAAAAAAVAAFVAFSLGVVAWPAPSVVRHILVRSCHAFALLPQFASELLESAPE